jgi:predicted protein tyrosine phosphatase
VSRILVCPADRVRSVSAEHGPSHVVALTAPGTTPPAIRGARMLHLTLNDITEPRPGLVPPAPADIRALLDFGAEWDGARPLLVHCRMGVSRSTAAALILAAAHRPRRAESDLAAALRKAAPVATPNALMVAFGDDLLGRAGRLVEAARSIGRGADYAPYRLAILDLD